MRSIVRLLIVALVVISIIGCASMERVSSDDPFSARLDTLNFNRINAQNWMLASAVTLVVGLIAGTALTTTTNLGTIDQGTGKAWIIVSYSVSTLAAGAGTYFFFDYNRQMNDYLETLRLQTQYNNAIQWGSAKKSE